jgi:ferredoxin
MDQDSAKTLWDAFPLTDKNDFFPAYLYLKHIDRFVYHSLLASGLPAGETERKPDPEVDEMMKYYVQHIAEASASVDTDTYHGKVVKLEDAIKLITAKQDLTLSPPEKVIPYKIARSLVLKADESIALGTCACRALSAKPCLPPPQEVCLFVGDPFASFMAAENPRFRKVSREEAVNVLEFSHKKGFVQTAYFKKELGNRFFSICNCCSCCCLSVKMWNLLEGAIPFLTASGYVAEVNDDCNGCAACVDGTCQFNAISIDEKEQKATIDLKKCMGCGVCVDVCPTKAIRLRREPSKGDPLDLDELMIQRHVG